MKTTRSLSLALALMLSGSALTGVFAQIEGPPNRIDYQGQVLDSAGNPLAPVTPTNYTMLFRLYNTQTGGTPLWSESQTVTVSKGAFSVRLGEGVAVPGDNIPSGVQTAGLASAFGGRDRYLGLTVVISGQTPVEITPRLAFLSSPFSFNAQKSKEADSVTILDAGGNNRVGSARWDQLFNMSTTSQADRADPAKWTLKEQNVPAGVSVPVGGVIMWWGASGAVPPGFEICSGGAPATPGALIATKPDLRDRFVKGAAAASGNVATANVSGGTNTNAATTTGGTALTQSQLPRITVQASELTALSAGNHQHRIGNDINPSADTDQGSGGYLASGDRDGDEAFADMWTNFAGAHTHQVSGTINTGSFGQTHAHSIPAQENRPAFLEMFYIIRVK